VPSPYTIVALISAVLGMIALFAALKALSRGRLIKLFNRLVLALLLLMAAMLFSAIGLGTQGYRAFTREEVAAVVYTQPLPDRHFRANFHFSDGSEQSYLLAGDELYVDARVLKWKPVANFIGLHTAYELDRVGGRYRKLTDERGAPRTIHTLARERQVDLFELRKRYTMLAPLLDAEYGSATFVSVDQPKTLEVRVSTTGLMIRPVDSRSK
jgi:hypothetical protein